VYTYRSLGTRDPAPVIRSNLTSDCLYDWYTKRSPTVRATSLPNKQCRYSSVITSQRIRHLLSDQVPIPQAPGRDTTIRFTFIRQATSQKLDRLRPWRKCQCTPPTPPLLSKLLSESTISYWRPSNLCAKVSGHYVGGQVYDAHEP